jgi:cation transport ATPase
MLKKQNKHRKAKVLTKKQEQSKRRRLRLWTAFFAALAFLFVFFNFTLAVSGSWDDLSMSAIFIAPIVAGVALLIAGINIAKYRAQNYELIAPLAILGLSAILFFTVSVINSAAVFSGI